MPTIYLYLGFIFKFYSDEHEPIHIHAKKGECETVFELIIENGTIIEIRTRKVRGKKMLPEKDEAEAYSFVKIYGKNIVEKWINFFILKKNIRTTKITKRI